MSIFDAYELVVGLECHVQLWTESKLFSPARNRYGDPPNENVDVVDLGLPGVLPVLNARAVEFAIRLGLALGCEIQPRSVFARKHYFYPDLPKGYQISQYDEPICLGGAVPILLADGQVKQIPLTRIHLEEDAGKNLHREGSRNSYCDYNRAGTPLLEVVSEPALHSAQEAMAYMRSLRSIVMYLGICDGNLQEGSMRADANVSVRQKGATALGQRTEIKNLNSPRFLGQAIEFEAQRHVVELSAGHAIVQETRLWDPDKRESRSMRGKEEAQDYRYLPDPDLPILVVTPEEIAAVSATLPELPLQKRARYIEHLGLSELDATVLTDDHAIATYFERALAAHDNAKGVANWVINEVLRVAKTKLAAGGDEEAAGIASAGISPEAIGQLVKLVDTGVVTGKIAKQVFAALERGEGDDPARIVEEQGLRVERDEGALRSTLEQILAQNPAQVEQYRGGKTQIFGFFVGQVMKATRGKADPAEVNRLLAELLA